MAKSKKQCTKQSQKPPPNYEQQVEKICNEIKMLKEEEEEIKSI